MCISIILYSNRKCYYGHYRNTVKDNFRTSMSNESEMNIKLLLAKKVIRVPVWISTVLWRLLGHKSSDGPVVCWVYCLLGLLSVELC